MYKIFLDGQTLHADNVEGLQIIDPKLELELNNYGTFEFDIVNSNPHFYNIKKMKSIITVFQDDTLIFRGRVEEDEEDTYKQKNIYCRGELTFFNDSIQENYNFQGSIKDFLKLILDCHNTQVEDYKRFKVGNVTVTDPNDYIVRADSTYLSTWETIKKKLIELLGGYIVARHENDETYIDYLADFTTLNAQAVEFGKNMLTVNTSESATDICTVLIPLGAKLESENTDTERRLTVESVNNGKKYIEYAEGIKLYGRITKTVTFDDVTLASNLLSKGKQTLREMCNIITSIEISAIDLASVKKDIHNFKMHSKIKVVSKFHNINDYFIPLKMNINLFQPESNKITLNQTRETLTSNFNKNDNLNNIVDVVENIQNNVNNKIPQTITTIKQELSSVINQTATNIESIVSDKYYTKSDTDSLISELNTILKQTSSYFEMQFNSFSSDLIDVINGNNASFEDIKKFIRFEDGNIILGEVGNEFFLKISKERISFMQSSQEIAYISNSKMYITFVETLHTLKIGRFGFIPRKNGNLTFKLLGGV